MPTVLLGDSAVGKSSVTRIIASELFGAFALLPGCAGQQSDAHTHKANLVQACAELTL